MTDDDALVLGNLLLQDAFRQILSITGRMKKTVHAKIFCDVETSAMQFLQSNQAMLQLHKAYLAVNWKLISEEHCALDMTGADDE